MTLQRPRKQFPIVDPATGQPTHYFLRLLRDSGIFAEDTEEVAEGAATDAGTALTAANTAQSEVDALEIVVANLGLDDLTDVDTTTTPPTDGQALIWDNAGSLWIPGDVAAGGGGGGSILGGVSLDLPAALVAQDIRAGVLVSFGVGSELYDTHDAHSEVTNPSRVTIPTGVTKARFFGALKTINQSTGDFANLRLYKNGSVLTQPLVYSMTTTDSVQQNWLQLVSPILEVTAGDYFELLAANESDSSINYEASFAAEWIEFSTGGSSGPTLVRPVAADFTRTTRSNGGETITLTDIDEGGGVIFKFDANSTASRGGFIGKAITTGVPFTLTGRIYVGVIADNFVAGGLAIQEDVDTDRLAASTNYYADTTNQYFVNYWVLSDMSTNTSAAGGTSQANMRMPGAAEMPWRRIKYDGTDLTFWMSPDGTGWLKYRTIPAANVFTGTIAYAGFGFYSVSSAGEGEVFCDHFDISYP